jgi:hypothetical protein
VREVLSNRDEHSLLIIVKMPPQDDARENRIVDLFNLERPANRVRHGTDAILNIDNHTLEFELKSVTTAGGGLTTVRDFGPDHIAKWKHKHWLIAVYQRETMVYCKYGSPAAMAPWIEEKWRYIRPDFELAKHVPEMIGIETMFAIIGNKSIYTKEDAKTLHKAQYSARRYIDLMDVTETTQGDKIRHVGYSPEKMLEILKDRARYVIERGSTLNNPHIPASYFAGWEEIRRDHAIRLRELVREWLAANQPQANVPLPAQRDKP